MVLYSAWRIFIFSIACVVFVCIDSCKEREWTNPFDDIPPEYWAPKNLQIIVNSSASITLTWEDYSIGEEGFRIDRKINEENWEKGYASIPPNSITFVDLNIDLEFNYYTYNLYAVAGLNHSAAKQKKVGLPPIVNTSASSDITINSVTCGGNVISSSSTIIARGVCWNISNNPTIENSHLNVGGGLGSFTSLINGLNPKTVYYLRAYATNEFGTAYGDNVIITTDLLCGGTFTVDHIVGIVAPENKTVNYKTNSNDLSGSTKCWITQNLGSDHEASNATDDTEGSAGWYWQFNKKRGFKHDGNTRTPNIAWISSINESSDWQVENDPCALLLGNGWRLPTYTEWDHVYKTGGWNNYIEAYGSPLKLHAAGYLFVGNGSLDSRGSYGLYWSSTQYDNAFGWYLGIGSQDCTTSNFEKADGKSVRCIFNQ